MLRSLGLHASAGVPRRTAGRLAMRPSASASVPASPAVLNYNGEQVTVEDASLAPLFKGELGERLALRPPCSRPLCGRSGTVRGVR